MAKAKKPAEKSPAKSASKPKTAAKSKSAPAPGSGEIPAIDTNLAASAAAAMLASRANQPTAAQPDDAAAPKKETSTFKQLKENLSKPHSQALGNLLDKTAAPGSKKSNLPFAQLGKQVGRNQTFGADVNRAGVRRR